MEKCLSKQELNPLLTCFVSSVFQRFYPGGFGHVLLKLKRQATFDLYLLGTHQ